MPGIQRTPPPAELSPHSACRKQRSRLFLRRYDDVRFVHLALFHGIEWIVQDDAKIEARVFKHLPQRLPVIIEAPGADLALLIFHRSTCVCPMDHTGSPPKNALACARSPQAADTTLAAGPAFLQPAIASPRAGKASFCPDLSALSLSSETQTAAVLPALNHPSLTTV